MAAQRMEGHGLHFLFLLGDLHFFTFLGRWFWVRTQEPPRIELLGKSVVGIITKSLLIIGVVIFSSPSPSVLKSALIRPLAL
jgi:hypothetical protein